MIEIENKNCIPEIAHLQGEVTLALYEGKDKERLQEIVNVLLPFLEKGFKMDEIRSILNSAIDYTYRDIIVPLTLTIGEFIFIKPGLSINRRNKRVKMDPVGIYYEDAYVVSNKYIFDAYSDAKVKLDIDNAEQYTDFVFLLYGGKITNVAFRKAYIKKSTIEKHSFYPPSSVVLDTAIYTLKNKYIRVARVNSKFNSLMNFYDLEIKEFDDKYLMNFGITFNISKDELFSKR